MLSVAHARRLAHRVRARIVHILYCVLRCQVILIDSIYLYLRISISINLYEKALYKTRDVAAHRGRLAHRMRARVVLILDCVLRCRVILIVYINYIYIFIK